ncbi:MAG: aromatic ring-hydroxylating dioxygenase subunit alpha [Actinomycetota bacterium]|nr:aromatic ring-hydroxylating dioxygenase subunit alpha [Actinomycetota bacterium]
MSGPLELTNTHPALRHCWHPVARSAEVGERPVRVLLLGEPWVLARLGDGGALAAFADRCPHRSAPLSIGSVAAHGGDGARVLVCAYHGWCFGAGGECVDIPALGPGGRIPPRARLRAAAGVAERHGMVFLRPDTFGAEAADPALEALGEVPDVAEAHDPGFMAGDLPVLGVRASAGMLADNFLDMAHFPFVHRETFGAGEKVVAPIRVERDVQDARGRWSFTAVSEHAFMNREDPGVAAGHRPLEQRRRVTYRVHAPFHLVLRLDFLDAGGTNVIGFFLQPETDERCRIFSTIWRDDLCHDPARMADAVRFEVKVIEEDLAVQEAYDVGFLPLDPTAEVHTRADRTTLELRRMLADLVEAASAHETRARQPTRVAP